mmetsp:Transcript_10202/g.13984  ORF Transcript_10202/g.13984 Transcript_10202/m.13984 type:complete len:248 (-) Transcript_10202:20-763(-)
MEARVHTSPPNRVLVSVDGHLRGLLRIAHRGQPLREAARKAQRRRAERNDGLGAYRRRLGGGLLAHGRRCEFGLLFALGVGDVHAVAAAQDHGQIVQLQVEVPRLEPQVLCQPRRIEIVSGVIASLFLLRQLAALLGLLHGFLLLLVLLAETHLLLSILLGVILLRITTCVGLQKVQELFMHDRIHRILLGLQRPFAEAQRLLELHAQLPERRAGEVLAREDEADFRAEHAQVECGCHRASGWDGHP